MCGLPTALSVIVRAPVRLPAAVGAKLMVRLQDCPGPRAKGTLTQLEEPTEKSPLIVIFEIVAKTFPVLIMVRFWKLLLLTVPTTWSGKSMLVGVTTIVWTTTSPLPARLTV